MSKSRKKNSYRFERNKHYLVVIFLFNNENFNFLKLLHVCNDNERISNNIGRLLHVVLLNVGSIGLIHLFYSFFEVAYHPAALGLANVLNFLLNPRS